MRYTVQLRPSAFKSFKNLPRKEQIRIAAAIESLAEDPRPAGVKKLAAEEDIWRIRIGQYRVIYQIEQGKLLILVLKIRHRKEVYR